MSAPVAALVLACAAQPSETRAPGPAARVTSPDSVRAGVEAVLRDQQAAWNRGDLEAFMRGYTASPALVFTSGGGVVRGYETVLERYRAAYGTGAEMGRLAFSALEVHPLGDAAAWALGRWSLERGGRRLGGVFTLVLEREDGAWRIVHDHTSSDPEPPAGAGSDTAPQGEGPQ